MKQKASKIDYSKAMLPRTRKAQFLDCFKMNYMLLLKCGLMLFAFALPLVAFSIFMDFYYMSIIEHATEAIEQTKLIFFYFYNGWPCDMSKRTIVTTNGYERITTKHVGWLSRRWQIYNNTESDQGKAL